MGEENRVVLHNGGFANDVSEKNEQTVVCQKVKAEWNGTNIYNLFVAISPEF